MTKQDLNAVLTGLRLLQRELDKGPLPAELDEILTDGGTDTPLDTEAIGDLCEELNCNTELESDD